MDEGADGLMADTLIAGTTLVEKESRSSGDIAVGGIIEFDDTYANVPDGFAFCDGATINDSRSPYNGVAVPNYNTNYWTIAGTAFLGQTETEQITRDINGNLIADAGGAIFYGGINLPEGATITAATCFGSDTGDIWEIKKKDVDASATVSIIATAVINTEDSTIADGIIDNIDYSYFFRIRTIDAADSVYGAKITYTPRQKFIIRIR